MNTYSAYKDSGEQWLGQIPEHWEMKEVKRLFQYHKNVVGKDHSKYERISLTLQGVLKRSKEDTGGLQPEKFDGYQIVYKWDLIFKLIDLANTATSRIGLSPYEGIVSPAYILLSNRGGVNPKYAEYFFKIMWYRHIFNALGDDGVRSSLPTSSLLRVNMPFPPLAEQEAMVAYLDEQTGIIDTAIERERKMIDLLEERKQIIIQQAVTKGLNPNAKMKDSGIEWIGEIPEGWEVRKLKYIGDSKNGLTYSPLDMVDENQGILVLRSSNIQKGKLSFEDNVYVKYAPKKLHVRKGDIIICSRNGSADLVGKCAIIDREMYATFGAFMMRFRSPHNDKYIYYLLSIAISKYKQLFATSTINQLTLGIFADMKVPIVLDELCQQTIVNYLDERLGNINRAIEAREKMIALLQERKQIIINEVVTGKIKVL